MDPTTKILDKAKRLKELMDLKSELENQLKEVNKEKQTLSTSVIPKLMEDAEVTLIRIDGIGTLYTQSDLSVGILVTDRERAHDWLKENGHESIVKESVQWQTLKSWAKEQLEEGNEIPDFFNAKSFTIARIRSSNG